MSDLIPCPMIRRVQRGQKIDWGWGAAWYDVMHDELVVAPIPLNWLFACARWLVCCAMRGPRKFIDDDTNRQRKELR
jgi:hypothetical protein